MMQNKKLHLFFVILRMMKPIKHTDPRYGLSLEEVKNSTPNHVEETYSKSYKKIVQTNIFTMFNAINLFLAFLVFMTGSYRNMLFMGVVISNALIGIVQEIRSKKKLDALALLNQPKAKVLREGNIWQIMTEEIVVNDIVILESGDQICVDGKIVEGMAEVNESLLTGESDAISKQVEDMVFSGSYVEAGHAKMQAIKVGEDTYAHSILKHAKREKKYPSQLRDSINAIIKFSTVILIPAGLLLFGKAYFISRTSLDASILSMVAAVVGMIPEGLVILTSVALAIGAFRLASQKVLVQELYCIETLARVDTLCLDKTGTITQGKMKVTGIESLSSYTTQEIQKILSSMFGALQDENATAMAIREYCDVEVVPVKQIIPFSSARKASAVIFEEEGFIIGAYPFIVKEQDPVIMKKIEQYSLQGIRVLTLCKAIGSIENELQGNHEPLALILIQDVLREHIHQILSYFYKQDVDIKIISGDDSHTVQAIAKQAGVKGKALDMRASVNLEKNIEEYSIFGRVTPEQKRDMIRTLKQKGHTVAMTGDGVNDVMALKEADCSIAMGSGSDATKNIASIVLLENQFASLPSILNQGRCVINNIQRTASLFLVKTLLSFGCSILTLFLLRSYPFLPIQLTLISALATGLPSFVLTLEPNHERVKGNFLQTVFLRAIPGAGCLLLAVLGVYLFGVLFNLNLDQDQFSTMCTILAGCNALCVLISVCKPMTRLRFVLVSFMILCFVVSCTIPFLQEWFCIYIEQLEWIHLIYVLVNIPVIFIFVYKMTQWIDKKKEKI